MRITKKRKYYFGFFVMCLIISFFVTAGCHKDEYYDDSLDDPLRGSRAIICVEDISWLQVLTRAIGFYIFGFIAHEVLKMAHVDLDDRDENYENLIF